MRRLIQLAAAGIAVTLTLTASAGTPPGEFDGHLPEDVVEETGEGRGLGSDTTVPSSPREYRLEALEDDQTAGLPPTWVAVAGIIVALLLVRMIRANLEMWPDSVERTPTRERPHQ